ncbi:MAG: hypothetical protein HY707_02240 [Ignavibacteriae bacterium]|nr:hypothetical protein [Ignavibacteriota bacterium]
MKEETQVFVEEKPLRVSKSGRREVIGEQQGKSFYRSVKPDHIIQEFTAHAPENGKKRINTKDLCALRNDISSYLFEYLNGFKIPTHFVSKLSETEMMIKQTERVHITVKIFNYANGILVKRFGLKSGRALEFPVIEHYYACNGTLSWVNEYHLYMLGVLTPEEFKQINRISSKTNAVLRGLCDRRQLLLADLQLEFGRHKNQILLSDELSPLTCHFIDGGTNGQLEKDRFLLDRDDAFQSISELRDRLKLKV